MRKTVFVILATALAPFCAFAVDGVLLINQSSVMAAGGFPYVISQTGSYKLSGNLIMNTSQSGNHQGSDLAIGIGASNVTLDLNGFTISVVNNILNLPHTVFGIAELGAWTGTTVQNGGITLTGTGSLADPGFYGFLGIYLRNSTYNRVEDFSVITNCHAAMSGVNLGAGIYAGVHSLVRHFLTDHGGLVNCPSVLVETVGLGIMVGGTCVDALNSN
jgi:hypothetical protein